MEQTQDTTIKNICGLGNPTELKGYVILAYYKDGLRFSYMSLILKKLNCMIIKRWKY